MARLQALTVTGTALTGNAVATIGAAGTASSLAGIPFFSDSSNFSMYTHDVSGTDSTAAGNTAYGFKAMDAITTGDDNTAMGENALSAITTGNNNVGYGKNAIQKAASSGGNVAVGDSALKELNYDGNSYNVAIGHNAGLNLTNSAYNTLVGGFVGDGFDTENHNTAFGYQALGGSVAGGEFNTCLGSYTGDAITSSDHNVLVGYAAGTDLQGGGALEGQNTCIGSNSGGQLTTGFQNICIGHSAGNGEGDGVGTDPLTGYRNILIGPYSNTQASDALHAIVIGYGISGAAQDFTFGRSSNVVSNDFDADANWSRSSDVRKKRNINDQGLGLDFINDLRTVNFQWKPSNEFPKEWKDYSEENNMDLDRVMHGFIAQEVKEALDKHASDQDKNFTGWTVGEDGMQNTSREMFVIPLIKAVQELSAQVEELKAKLEDK